MSPQDAERLKTGDSFISAAIEGLCPTPLESRATPAQGCRSEVEGRTGFSVYSRRGSRRLFQLYLRRETYPPH